MVDNFNDAGKYLFNKDLKDRDDLLLMELDAIIDDVREMETLVSQAAFPSV